MAVVNLDDPSDVAAWNCRAPAPAPTDAELRELCFGPTPLIAATRCYVASKLGNEVEVPEELIATISAIS